MARMHSRAKGKSGSKKPTKKVQPSWIRYKPKEIEMLIVKLAKEGKTPSQIGMILRDTYGVPDVELICSKKLTVLLKEKDLLSKIPEDLMALIKKSIVIRKHLEENKHDQTARRGLNLTESKIKRLIKYYRTTERILSDWTYDPEKIRLLIE